MKKLYSVLAAAAVALSASADIYVCGAGEGLAWEPASPKTVTLNGDGNYEFTSNGLTQFKVSTAMGSWDDFNAGAKWAALDEVEPGTWVDMVDGDGNISVAWKGDYTITIKGDLSQIMGVTTTPKPSENEFTKIYLRGGWDEGWAALPDWEMETADGVTYWFDCTGATMIPAGTQWKIADDSWDTINYGADGDIYPDEFSTIWNYNAGNGVCAEDYVGTVKFVKPSEKRGPAEVTIFPEIVEHAGVSVIATENNAPAEYFNLQGVRVANPENGLYIVRRGTEVSKVIVK